MGSDSYRDTRFMGTSEGELSSEVFLVSLSGSNFTIFQFINNECGTSNDEF